MDQWTDIVAADPSHSERYAQRWARLVAEGKDIDGEARLIDAMADRAARIFDAGCGQGRVAGYLAARGHHVTGVDIDPVLLSHAREAFPDVRFVEGDLTTDTVPDPGTYDLVVCAGQVVTFMTVPQVADALRLMGAALAPNGRLVLGFGLSRGLTLTDYTRCLDNAGLVVTQRFSTWQCHPFSGTEDFLVDVLVRAE